MDEQLPSSVNKWAMVTKLFCCLFVLVRSIIPEELLCYPIFTIYLFLSPVTSFTSFPPVSRYSQLNIGWSFMALSALLPSKSDCWGQALSSSREHVFIFTYFKSPFPVLIPGKRLTLVSNPSNCIHFQCSNTRFLGPSVLCFFDILPTDFLITCFPYSDTCVSSRCKWCMNLNSTPDWSSYEKFYAMHGYHHRNSVSFHSPTQSVCVCVLPICF